MPAPVLLAFPWHLLTFQDDPLWLVAAAFVAAGAVTWYAGWKLSVYGDVIAEEWGLQEVLVGVLLLAGATSLPEVTTSLTAASVGNAELAVNNLLGGVVQQVVLLAAADYAVGVGALTVLASSPALVLEGLVLILLLAITIGALALGGGPAVEVPLGGLGSVTVGAWTPVIAGLYVGAMVLMERFQGTPGFREDAAQRKARGDRAPREPTSVSEEGEEARDGGMGGGRAVVYFGLAAVAVLVAGFTAARSADALAHRTGFASTFMGAAFLAMVTSLPELSTTLSAVNLRAYSMAFSNAVGADLIGVGLLFLVDVAYPGPPVLGVVGAFAIVAAALGILVVGVYMLGLVTRVERQWLNMGWESWVALLVFVVGYWVLYGIR